MVPTRHCIQLPLSNITLPLYCIRIKIASNILERSLVLNHVYCVQKNTDSTDPAVRIEHHHLICNVVEYSEYMTRKDKGAIKIEIGSIFSEGVENDGQK